LFFAQIAYELVQYNNVRKCFYKMKQFFFLFGFWYSWLGKVYKFSNLIDELLLFFLKSKLAFHSFPEFVIVILLSNS